MLKISIFDGYIDEPTCLGVPPYISPYPRYTAGAIWNNDKSSKINYMTIDQVRNDKSFLETLSNSDLVIVIAGMTVPGRYLSGFPASPNELVSIMSNLSPIKILCGPAARYGFGIAGGKKTKELDIIKDVFDIIVKGDAEIVVSKLLENKLNIDNTDPLECRKNANAIKDYAVKGSSIVTQHPFYPHYLIAEIETYRGCPRTIVGGCSFCSEPSKGLPDYRQIKDIADEVKALYENGVRHIRLGNQPCIFSYMSKDAGQMEFARPNPEALEKLFKCIRNVAPNLKTLHIDNANPGVIALYQEECETIAKTIVKYHTSGDVAALGIESIDPVVIKKNNLKVIEDEAFSAIKLLNDVGSKRGNNGMPELLPGLNFVFGLDGETKNTYELNYEFLKKILDQKLLLRRINLRQIIPILGTKMYQIGTKIISKNKYEFQRFKRRVRMEIEQQMLKNLLPNRTILKDVFAEKYEGKLTFGRQIGTYPLLIGIPGVYPLNQFYNVIVIDYGYRSITALPYPVDINRAPRQTIEAIPGIGKKRAIRIIAKRPFNNIKQLISALDSKEISEEIKKYITIKH